MVSGAVPCCCGWTDATPCCCFRPWVTAAAVAIATARANSVMSNDGFVDGDGARLGTAGTVGSDRVGAPATDGGAVVPDVDDGAIDPCLGFLFC